MKDNPYDSYDVDNLAVEICYLLESLSRRIGRDKLLLAMPVDMDKANTGPQLVCRIDLSIQSSEVIQQLQAAQAEAIRKHTH